ncbi:MAG: serine protease Do [Acidimicrobiaceae bacterium]|nr:serine protease Do [Acidimicrobiaceae bacterium]
MPRTVLGLSVLILAFAIGAAFSGVVFYSYYEFRKDTSEKRTAKFVEGFDQRFATAQKTIDAERENAKAEIAKELEPLKKIRAEGETLDGLVKKSGPAVWFVRTLDGAGQPSVGSAFVVASDNAQSLMLTSFTTVEAATHNPGPQVTVRKGDQEVKATLWTWQPDRDLALLVVPKGNQPKLDFAETNPPLKTGERVFALSGLGAAGAAITQGFVADVSSAGIQHDATIGPAFQGGPLVNSDGKVLAVSSRSYGPLGFRTDSVWFGVPIRAACDRILKCPSGAVSGAGDRSAQTPAPAPPP